MNIFSSSLCLPLTRWLLLLYQYRGTLRFSYTSFHFLLTGVLEWFFPFLEEVRLQCQAFVSSLWRVIWLSVIIIHPSIIIFSTPSQDSPVQVCITNVAASRNLRGIRSNGLIEDLILYSTVPLCKYWLTLIGVRWIADLFYSYNIIDICGSHSTYYNSTVFWRVMPFILVGIWRPFARNVSFWPEG